MSRAERRMASAFTEWLDGGAPPPDPATRAIADTARLIVDALAPEPLSAATRQRLLDRALAGAEDAGADSWSPVRQTLGQLPGPAWIGLGAAGVLLGVALLRHREAPTLR